MLLTQQTAGSVWGYGLFIVETLAALGLIAAAGYLVVRYFQKRLDVKGNSGRLRLVERLTLEPRRSVHLIEVDDKPYLIGTSEHSVQLLTPLEVDREDARKETPRGTP